MKKNDNLIFLQKFKNRIETIGKNGVLDLMKNTGEPINNNDNFYYYNNNYFNYNNNFQNGNFNHQLNNIYSNKFNYNNHYFFFKLFYF